MGGGLGDYSSHRGLRAGSRRGGHRPEGADAGVDPQDALEFCHRLARVGHLRRNGLGRIHGAAAAKGHNALAGRFDIPRKSRLHVQIRGVGLDVGKDLILKARLIHGRNQASRQSQFHQALVSD